MLPNKHYSGPEIEQVLVAVEEGTPINSVATYAEESTIQRWKRQFSSVIPVLCAQLEALAYMLFMEKTSLSSLPDRPLSRLKKALGHLEKHRPEWTLLGRSYFRALAHPVCIG
jgi:hypothetical protein